MCCETCSCKNSKEVKVEKKEFWFTSRWRPIAAAVYLFICVLDFVAMPIYYEVVYNKDTTEQSISYALKFKDSAAQIEALRLLQNNSKWFPITLNESGLFHVAFGAILGAAAWTRGKEKAERERFNNER